MKPCRIQLRRTKGWRLPTNTLIVCRPGKFGNPIRVGAVARIEVNGSMYDAQVTPAIAMEFFREYFAGVVRTEPGILDFLRGKNLACWCPLDQPCHADVLLELANK
jgi:hypothetical protein